MNKSPEGISPSIASADRKKQLTGVFCKLTGKMNDILNDSTNAFTTDNFFRRSFTLIDRFLPKHTQDVVSNHSEFKNQLVCVKLT